MLRPATGPSGALSRRPYDGASGALWTPVADLLARLQSALHRRYAVEREIGHGGMATVYLARDLKHDREVALKRLRPELAIAVGAEPFLRVIHILAPL